MIKFHGVRLPFSLKFNFLFKMWIIFGKYHQKREMCISLSQMNERKNISSFSEKWLKESTIHITYKPRIASSKQCLKSGNCIPVAGGWVLINAIHIILCTFHTVRIWILLIHNEDCSRCVVLFKHFCAVIS